MATASVYARDARYVLTPAGRDALQNADTCQCSQLWISDGVYCCHVCGTVYGVVFGMTITPRRLQTATHGGVR